VANYDVNTFGGTIDTVGGYQVWTADGMTVYHGSHEKVDVQVVQPAGKYEGIWFSPDFQCALGAATTKVKGAGSADSTAGGSAIVVEYTLTNDDCKPFLLLGVGAENNAKILFENDFFKAGTDEKGVVSMGLPSARIKDQLKNFCEKEAYCGWRSPYDQNEIFICSNCMLACLTNKNTYYKVAYDKLPKNMAAMYWFPNQKGFDNMGEYDEGDGKGAALRIMAGRQALKDGKTLAFYAWTNHSENVQKGDPQDEGVPQDDFDMYQIVPMVQEICDESTGRRRKQKRPRCKTFQKQLQLRGRNSWSSSKPKSRKKVATKLQVILEDESESTPKPEQERSD